MSGRLFDVDGLTFRIERAGPPDARVPPVVLVHGIGMSHRYFRRLRDVLALDGAVYTVDLPGFGGLPKPGSDVDVATMARALGSVLDRAEVGPIVLVGHSMGAQWAVELAAQRPDLVETLTIIGPVTDDAHRSFAAQAAALSLDTIGEAPHVNVMVFTDYLRCGIPWYLTQLRHMLEYRIEERVTDLEVPLLVMRGANDPIAGIAWCRRLRDAARDAVFVQIPRGRHVVQHSAPRAVASAIRAHAAGELRGTMS